MFTGIVQAVGTIQALDGSRLTASAGFPSDEPLQTGESIAVNGCCLTVLSDIEPLRFDLSEETISRSTLGQLRAGDPVNLERAIRPTDRLGGHIVQGHVDAIGRVRSIQEQTASTVFEFEAPVEFDRYLIDKGSVAIEGISLTVVKPAGGRFQVSIIPHTLKHTNLRAKKVGDVVNLEFDLVAKYVEKLTAHDSI